MFNIRTVLWLQRCRNPQLEVHVGVLHLSLCTWNWIYCITQIFVFLLGANKFWAAKDCLEKLHSFVKTASNILEGKYWKLLIAEYLGRYVVLYQGGVSMIQFYLFIIRNSYFYLLMNIYKFIIIKIYKYLIVFIFSVIKMEDLRFGVLQEW